MTKDGCWLPVDIFARGGGGGGRKCVTVLGSLDAEKATPTKKTSFIIQKTPGQGHLLFVL